MSPGSKVIFAMRGVACSARTSASSVLMTPRSLPSSARIASSSAIVSRSCVISSSSSCASEAREAAERHVEDVVRLDVAELERRRHEAVARAAAIL